MLIILNKISKLPSILGFQVILLFFISFNKLLATLTKEFIDNNKHKPVVIRLNNGDVISCEITGYEFSNNEIGFLEVSTEIGKTKIYPSEIAEIIHYLDYNRHSHRIYILPTAEPIGDNHFVGNYEILFFYAGAGIGNLFSITAGRSILPTVLSEHQISIFNIKATLYQQYWETMEGNMSVAVGYNYAMVNNTNVISHPYGTISFRGAKSILTASVFTKIGNKDYYEARFGDNFLPFAYENGSFGFALGLTTRFASTRDIYFIGELWNSNITKPGNSALLLGFRIGNTKLAADFGISVFGAPYFVPFTNFIWTLF